MHIDLHVCDNILTHLRYLFLHFTNSHVNPGLHNEGLFDILFYIQMFIYLFVYTLGFVLIFSIYVSELEFILPYPKQFPKQYTNKSYIWCILH